MIIMPGRIVRVFFMHFYVRAGFLNGLLTEALTKFDTRVYN